MSTTICSREERERNAQFLDEHDETYANHLRNLFLQYIPEHAQKAFNNYTDDLMAESRISRSILLEALYAFKKTAKYVPADWPDFFHDAAFNFRPYQCTIS
jgi:hypothetical protein